MPTNNPSGEQHEENAQQERMEWAEKTLKQQIEGIVASLNDILGKENYVIDREGNVSFTRGASVEPKEESAVKDLEVRLRQLYADLKKIKGKS